MIKNFKTMVKRSVDQKLRLRNFAARHGRIESGAVVKRRKGFIGVEGGKGFCYQWKEKDQCSNGDQCSFRHGAKPTPKAAPPSEPQSSKTRGGSVSRKRNVRGRSQSGKFNRQPCKYFLKGICTKSPCEYWHLPECQFYENETGCKAGDKCLFPHYKVEENNQEKSRKRAFKTEKSDDKGAEAVVTAAPQLPSGLPRSVKYRGNPRRKVLGSIRRVRFAQSTQRQASIRVNKGPSLGKIQVKNSHQRSPDAMKFEDRSQEETERQERCARSKAWKLAKNIHKLKEKPMSGLCQQHPP